MTNAARLSGVGTFYAFEFDDNTNSSFSVSIASTAFSNEFDENTSTTLSGAQRMSATSSGGVIVLDSINEIDPFGEISTDGLQLHVDSVDSTVTNSGGTYYWEDLSGNNRDMTFVNGGTNPVSGNFINFDGTDDYAACDGAGTGASSYLGIDGTGARTSIVFFKLDSNTITTQQRLLAWGLPGTTGGKWAMELSTANEINIGVAGGSRRTVTTYDFSKWTMIAATYPGGVGDTTDIRIWVNGIEQTNLGGTTQTVDTDTTTESTGYVSVGAAVLQGVAPINTPNGFVDGLFAKAMIYNRELSDLEIKVVYRSILRRLVG